MWSAKSPSVARIIKNMQSSDGEHLYFPALHSTRRMYIYVSQKKKEKKKRKARCEEVGEFSDSDGEKTHIEIE